MSSPVASTSALQKVSKNPGLVLVLERVASKTPSSKYAVDHLSTYSYTVDSNSNTPELEFDWSRDDSTSDSDSDDGAQYVYITADSPYYRALSSPRTSSYLSFTGFPFACDALAEEDPLFKHSPKDFFDVELDDDGVTTDRVVVVDPEQLQDLGPRSEFEWDSIKGLQKLPSVKSAQLIFEIEADDELSH